MAQKVTITLVDDVDGSIADETIEFGLDGVTYAIDLSQAHAEELREALAKFVTSARRSGGRRLPTRGGASAAAAPIGVNKERNRRIRAWAQQNGYTLADRGRIPLDIVNAYEQATANGAPDLDVDTQAAAPEQAPDAPDFASVDAADTETAPRRRARKSTRSAPRTARSKAPVMDELVATAAPAAPRRTGRAKKAAV
ncbi:hypothetical protein JOD54_002156 [Actinokineospora baliensis]|nr:hypothetical protein [Actinokineospora baliensis]